MHPTVLLFVLLFIPNSGLKDWQAAPAPILHELMDNGALSIMNARTAERDQISTSAGERSILAGARLYAADSHETVSYSSNPNNLTDALSDSGIEVTGLTPAPQLVLPFDLPQQNKRFVVANLVGSWDQIDQQIAQYASLVRQHQGLLMIASPNPTPAEYDEEHQLTPVLLWGPGVPSSYLQSASTRTPGLIVNTDIAPTIASIMDSPLPDPAYGTTISAHSTRDDKVTRLLQRENAWADQANVLRMLPFIAGALALLILLVYNIKQQRIDLAASIVAVTIMVPLVLMLSTNAPVFIGLLLLSMVIAVKALMPDDAAPFTSLTVIIMVTIDAFFFDGRLTGGSMLGYSPIEGARYYGIGNEVMGAYIGALTVITGLWDWHGEHRTPIIVMWLIAALALGLPGSGAKAGGLIVAAVTLTAYICVGQGKKLYDIRTLIAIAASIVAAAVLLVAVSHYGPASHVSDTVALAQSGGIDALFQTALRKYSMDIYLVFHSVWIWVLLLASYGRWRMAKGDVLSNVGTAAVLACLFFNDSGVIAAAICSLTVWAAEFNRDKGTALVEATAPVSGLV